MKVTATANVDYLPSFSFDFPPRPGCGSTAGSKAVGRDEVGHAERAGSAEEERRETQPAGVLAAGGGNHRHHRCRVGQPSCPPTLPGARGLLPSAGVSAGLLVPGRAGGWWPETAACQRSCILETPFLTAERGVRLSTVGEGRPVTKVGRMTTVTDPLNWRFARSAANGTNGGWGLAWRPSSTAAACQAGLLAAGMGSGGETPLSAPACEKLVC